MKRRIVYLILAASFIFFFVQSAFAISIEWDLQDEMFDGLSASSSMSYEPFDGTYSHDSDWAHGGFAQRSVKLVSDQGETGFVDMAMTVTMQGNYTYDTHNMTGYRSYSSTDASASLMDGADIMVTAGHGLGNDSSINQETVYVSMEIGKEYSVFGGVWKVDDYVFGGTPILYGEYAYVSRLFTATMNVQFKESSQISSTPEPTSLALMGLGLFGILIARKRRIKN